jgi:hypothetical protein
MDVGGRPAQVSLSPQDFLKVIICLSLRGGCEPGSPAEAAPTQAKTLLHSHRTLVRKVINTDFKKSVPESPAPGFKQIEIKYNVGGI